MKLQKNLPASGIMLVLLVLFLVLTAPVSAEIIGFPQGMYALDLPEGYTLADGNGSTRFLLKHTLFPVELQIAQYPENQFTDAAKALSWVTKQLSSTGPEAVFEWRRKPAAIAQIQTGNQSGWALALELENDKGWLVLATYVATAKAAECENIMVSTLDAVFTDEGSWFEPGPMTAFAWQKQEPIKVHYRDAKRDLEVPFDAIDADANQAVVDREFALLTAYLKSPLVEDAWKRYYRMIWRDGWRRLEKAGFIVSNTLPKNPAAAAAEILAWTQGFEYERNFEGADFLNLPEAFVAKTGDCDSRALLMVIMLNQMGIDAVLLVSPEFSHAVAAVDVPGTGARFTVGDKKYLIADTTSKVAIGLIPQDMADPAKWFAVTFYAFTEAAK